jgi:hypothetical protein
MKLLLLKILLQRRARDEGFTLPMVIALGLVMILLGAVSMTIANEENITAISQNSRSDALAIAEIGVARYRELLDRNRVLAIYDHAQWATRTTRVEVCNNEDKDISSFLQGATSQDVADTQDIDNDGNTAEIIGSYSLVSYNYSNVDGFFNRKDDLLNSDALGKLTVRGRAGTATNNLGEAQIQVDIPIRINRDDLTNLAPALWIGDNTISAADLGPLTIGNGNVVIKDQATTIADGCRNFSDTDITDGSQNLASTVTFPVPPTSTPPTPRGTVISDSRNLPSIQKIIDDVARARTALDIPVGTIPVGTSINPISSSSGDFGSTLHKPYNPDSNTTNCPNIKLCRYYYNPPTSATPLTYTDTNLLTDGIARTTLLLNQPLTINATTGTVRVGSTATISSSDAFEIYVNGNKDITLNANGGNIIINGFIHARESTLTIEGTGNVTINGSVWVNDFVNTSTGIVNISPDMIRRVATPSNPDIEGRAYRFYDTTAEFYSSTPEMTNRPLTGSPTNWKTEEVN